MTIYICVLDSSHIDACIQDWISQIPHWAPTHNGKESDNNNNNK